MINIKYLQYIPEEKHEEIYNKLLEDVYYFYTSKRVNSNQIKLLNGNKWDLSKLNMIIINHSL